MDPLVIPGTIVRGTRSARGTLHLQRPFFRAVFPEVSECWEGTINVCLQGALRVRDWDFTTAPIPWDPKHPDRPERFSFLRVRFHCADRTVAAWVYHPHDSPHRANPFIVELLLTEHVQVPPDRACAVEVDRPYQTTPVYAFQV